MGTLLAIGIIAALYFLTRKWPGMPSNRGYQTYFLTRPEIFRLCWADRVAMIWAIFLIIIGALLQIPWGPSWGNIILYFIAPPWIFLRAVDLITAGPRRRRAVRATREGLSPPYYIGPQTEVLPPETTRATQAPDWSRIEQPRSQ